MYILFTATTEFTITFSQYEVYDVMVAFTLPNLLTASWNKNDNYDFTTTYKVTVFTQLYWLITLCYRLIIR